MENFPLPWNLVDGLSFPQITQSLPAWKLYLPTDFHFGFAFFGCFHQECGIVQSLEQGYLICVLTVTNTFVKHFWLVFLSRSISFVPVLCVKLLYLLFICNLKGSTIYFLHAANVFLLLHFQWHIKQSIVFFFFWLSLSFGKPMKEEIGKKYKKNECNKKSKGVCQLTYSVYTAGDTRVSVNFLV